MNVQIAILEVQRHAQAFSLNRRKQSGIDVEIDRVAKLITFADGGCFHAGGKINSVVSPGSAFAETSKQVSQCFVTQEVEPFFCDLEMHVAWQGIGNFAWTRSSLL